MRPCVVVDVMLGRCLYKRCSRGHLRRLLSSRAIPKDVSGEFPTLYNSDLVEAGWFQWWEENGFFKPEHSSSDGEVYSAVLPPPNITGDLHLGHALTVAIQDTLARWHRMRGYRVCWVPGLDHAGIATQALLERVLHLTGSHGRRASREELLKMAHSWQKQKEANIENQLKRLGASLDFSRKRFTMDEVMTEAVKEAFVLLFDKGLIYRDKKMVNWSYCLASTISDIEVKHVDVSPGGGLFVPDCAEQVDVGFMDRIAYPVDDSELDVCTTRLESVLADTALAVHPQDNRYAHLVGRRAIHPITGRHLPIVADPMVDREFGTGVLKVTPGHCVPDYILGKKHGLPIVNCFQENGRVSDAYPGYAGLTRWEARSALRTRLSQLGLYRGRQPHAVTVPMCSRSGDLLDYRLRSQFFLRCNNIAQQALEAATSGSLQFVPDHYRKVWVEWLSKPEDWCISRQLWWGHQIPAYRVIATSEETWVSGRTAQEAASKAAVQLGIPENEVQLQQDGDVLDTWFSSALFPFSVFGWPKQTESLKAFYPLSLMETGHDILFFWVAHMVMLGQELTGQLPFHKVLLHGLIRDPSGRKMSKSVGNVVDPVHVIQGTSLKVLHERSEKLEEEGYLSKEELYGALQCQKRMFPQGIPKCGADSLRLALLSADVKAENISFNVQNAIHQLHFCNKVWQAVRFFLSAIVKLPRTPNLSLVLNPSAAAKATLCTVDLWILSCLAHTVDSCNNHLDCGDVHLYIAAAQHFFVQRLCDVYLEAVKPTVWGGDVERLDPTCKIIWLAIQTAIRLLAPAMPFLAEELHQRLAVLMELPEPGSICMAHYPTTEQWHEWKNADLERDMASVLAVVTSLRNIKLTCGIKRPSAYVVAKEPVGLLHEMGSTMQHLAWMRDLQVVSHSDWQGPPSDVTWTSSAVSPSVVVYVETDNTKLQEVLSERTRRLTSKMQKLEQRMSHPQYRRRTSKADQEKHANEVANIRREIDRLLRQQKQDKPVDVLTCEGQPV